LDIIILILINTERMKAVLSVLSTAKEGAYTQGTYLKHAKHKLHITDQMYKG
jgi:hypothetical protein